jgi:hypothetical protein
VLLVAKAFSDHALTRGVEDNEQQKVRVGRDDCRHGNRGDADSFDQRECAMPAEMRAKMSTIRKFVLAAMLAVTAIAAIAAMPVVSTSAFADPGCPPKCPNN